MHKVSRCTSTPLISSSSIFGLTDSNSTLVSTYAYDPYGNLTSSTGSVANPWRFAGGYFDSSTGLYKFGTRYYDAAIGRWTQQDPLRGHLDDPTSLNRYVYAGDDPVNLTDPSGTCTVFELILYILGAIAVVGITILVVTTVVKLIIALPEITIPAILLLAKTHPEVAEAIFGLFGSASVIGWVYNCAKNLNGNP